MVNLYGPNKPYQRENFFQILNTYITSNQNTTFGEDFNMVTDLKDRVEGNICNKHLVRSISLNQIVNTQTFLDTWRKRNPTTVDLTYHRPQSNTHSRLNRIYASHNLKIINSHILPFQYSDLEALVTEFTLGSGTRDPGYCKLNTFILQHETFKKATENLWHDWQNQKDSYNSIATWWDIGKFYFKMLATQYCIQMQKNIRKKQTQLTELIKKEKYNPNPGQHKINNAHQQLQDIDNYKTAGSIICSKEKLILEQEKPNRFFFDQEKRKQKSKTIKQLQHTTNNETKTITTDYEILKYWKHFFSNLYTKTKTNMQIQEELLTPIQPKINNQNNQKLTQEITLTELKNAIFQMESAKSPGIDVLPIEFYKTQYELIKNDLLQLYNSILFRNESIPTSLTKAIITLIPKTDTKELWKNWRLISFLFVTIKS